MPVLRAPVQWGPRLDIFAQVDTDAETEEEVNEGFVVPNDGPVKGCHAIFVLEREGIQVRGQE